MPRQLTFDLFSEPTSAYSPAIAAALAALSAHGYGESRGAVFTRVEVVEFILNLVGYTIDQPLHRRRLLEPSCGGGDFLLPAVDRLLAAWRMSDCPGDAREALGNAIAASRDVRGHTTKAQRQTYCGGTGTAHGRRLGRALAGTERLPAGADRGRV